jgi:hypothetical protein
MAANKKKNNNATKKAKKRAALVTKMKDNIQHSNRIPKPIYEEPAVTEMRNAVLKKFTNNIKNNTKKQKNQKNKA